MKKLSEKNILLLINRLTILLFINASNKYFLILFNHLLFTKLYKNL